MNRHPLEEIRHNHGLTQRALAKKANCSLRAINDLELGKRIPYFFTRRKILKALNIDFSQHMLIFDPDGKGYK